MRNGRGAPGASGQGAPPWRSRPLREGGDTAPRQADVRFRDLAGLNRLSGEHAHGYPTVAEGSMTADADPFGDAEPGHEGADGTFIDDGTEEAADEVAVAGAGRTAGDGGGTQFGVEEANGGCGLGELAGVERERLVAEQRCEGADAVATPADEGGEGRGIGDGRIGAAEQGRGTEGNLDLAGSGVAGAQQLGCAEG